MMSSSIFLWQFGFGQIIGSSIFGMHAHPSSYSILRFTIYFLEPYVIRLFVYLFNINTVNARIYNVCFVGKLTASSVPFQFKNSEAWRGIGKGKFDNYCIGLFKELLPNLKRKIDIAEHAFQFLLRRKIKGCEVSYYGLPRNYQEKVLA